MEQPQNRDDFIKCALVTAVKEVNIAGKDSGEKIVIYPIISGENLTLFLKLNFQLREVKLFDMTGKFIERIYRGNSSPSKLVWNIKRLKSGVYILKIVTENGEFQKKFIILR